MSTHTPGPEDAPESPAPPPAAEADPFTSWLDWNPTAKFIRGLAWFSLGSAVWGALVFLDDWLFEGGQPYGAMVGLALAAIPYIWLRAVQVLAETADR